MAIKKILITCENYYPIGGGIQQYHRALGKILSKRGIEVHIMHLYNTDVEDGRELWGAKLHNCRLLIGSLSDPFSVLNRRDEIAVFIQKINPDIVYANNHNSLAVIEACKKINMPVVYGCHGVGLLCPLKIRFLKPDNALCYNKRSYYNCFKCFRQMNRWTGKWIRQNFKEAYKLFFSMFVPEMKKYINAEKILSKADYRLGNSTLTGKLFKKRKNSSGLPLLMEYSGEHGYYPVNSDDFKKKYGLDEYVIVAGRLSNLKGQIYAVEALAMMPTHIKMVLAGNSNLWLGDKDDSGWYGELIKAKIESLGLKDRVVFTGRLDIDEMREAYSGAVVAIVPSVWLETFGYVVIEPLACETPVVVTENCGAVECVDSSCAVIVPRCNPSAIASAICGIMPKAEKMGKAGRKKLMVEFPPEKLADKTLEIFNKLIKLKRD